MKKFSIISIIILAIIILFGWPYYTVSTLVGTISGTEVKKINGEDIYLVSIKDDEGKINTFTIKDSLAHLQYRSSDLYGSVDKGDKVEIKGYGLRLPLISKYKNIYDVTILESMQEEIKKGQQDVFFEKNGNIYIYHTDTKKLELYDENIFKLQTINNIQGKK